MRKYKHNFYARKRYLELVEKKNAMVREQLEEYNQQAKQEMMRNMQEMRAKKIEEEARKNHFLLSTAQVQCCSLIAALIFSAGYYSAPNFFTIQRIWIVLGRCLFLRSVHTFSWFLKSNWSILVTPKQEVERKSEWFCGVKFFRSKFKVEWENGVWTKIRFLASGFLFTCGNFTLIFTVFSIF